MTRWLLIVGLCLATAELQAQRVVKVATVVTDFEQEVLVIDTKLDREVALTMLPQRPSPTTLA